jgi:hypothetical protein
MSTVHTRECMHPLSEKMEEQWYSVFPVGLIGDGHIRLLQAETEETPRHPIGSEVIERRHCLIHV